VQCVDSFFLCRRREYWGHVTKFHRCTALFFRLRTCLRPGWLARSGAFNRISKRFDLGFSRYHQSSPFFLEGPSAAEIPPSPPQRLKVCRPRALPFGTFFFFYAPPRGSFFLGEFTFGPSMPFFFSTRCFPFLSSPFSFFS